MPAKVECAVELLDKKEGANSATYVDIPIESGQTVLIDTTKYVNPTFYFEALLKIPGAGNTSYAQLYDVTGGAAVAGSEVSEASSTSYVRRRSGAITLTTGARQYKVQIRNTTANVTEVISAARIIVVDDFTAGWTKAEEQIEIGNVESTTSTTNVELTNPARILYEATKRDGTIAAYFEAVIYNASGKTIYASLYDRTASAVVTGSEVSTTSTTPTRVRSGAITLTDAHEYTVVIRVSAKTGNITGAKLVIQQSGTITKTQLHKRTANYFSTSLTSPQRLYSTIYLDKSNLPTTLTFTYQGVIKSSDVASTADSDLYNVTDGAIASEVATSLTTYQRLTSSFFGAQPANLKEYDSRLFSEFSIYIAYLAAGWMIIDAVYVPVVVAVPRFRRIKTAPRPKIRLHRGGLRF